MILHTTENGHDSQKNKKPCRDLLPKRLRVGNKVLLERFGNAFGIEVFDMRPNNVEENTRTQENLISFYFDWLAGGNQNSPGKL